MDGRVKVNGNIINELGTKVKPGIDKVEFDDKEINNNVCNKEKNASTLERELDP